MNNLSVKVLTELGTSNLYLLSLKRSTLDGIHSGD